MRLNVHAGHNADGRIACGAGGVFTESTAARNVKDNVIAQLRAQGHEVYDCTVDDAANERDNLIQIVNKCNAHSVDLDVSIHFNASNGAGHGTEVLVYSKNNSASTYAQRIVNEISGLGFSNRGVKERTNLYVLNHTKAPALLIECCFCDNWDDASIYNPNSMADAIVRGITGQNSIAPINPGCTTAQQNNVSCTTEQQPAPAPTNSSCTTEQKEQAEQIDWEGIKRFVISCGQGAANNFVGHDQIVCDGVVGPATRKMKIRVLQHAVNKYYGKKVIEEDGIWGEKSNKAFGNIAIWKGQTNWIVTAVEICCMINGCDPRGVEYPGTFGNGLASACDNHEYLNADTIKFIVAI